MAVGATCFLSPRREGLCAPRTEAHPGRGAQGRVGKDTGSVFPWHQPERAPLHGQVCSWEFNPHHTCVSILHTPAFTNSNPLISKLT